METDHRELKQPLWPQPLQLKLNLVVEMYLVCVFVCGACVRQGVGMKSNFYFNMLLFSVLSSHFH